MAGKLSKLQNLVSDSLSVLGNIFMGALFINSSERRKVQALSNSKVKFSDFPDAESCVEIIHDCHPLILCYFGRKIISISSECFDEIVKLKINQDQNLMLQFSNVIDVLQSTIISNIAEGALNGRFYSLIFSISSILYL